MKDLHGKVVVVEFWATWCGPCTAGIPHLNELHEKYNKDGLVILSLTDQCAKAIEKFAKDRGMQYAVGAGSETGKDYGVAGIPHALVIGRDGKLRWQGNPNDDGFEKQIADAIKSK